MRDPRHCWSAARVAAQSLVQADLPGVRKEDVSVRIEDDALVLEGHRHQENTRDQGFYHSERTYGGFYRLIPLPEGTDADSAQATFRDGVLYVEVPISQQRQRGRRLEIRDGGGAQSHLGNAAGGGLGTQSGGHSAGVAGTPQASGENASARRDNAPGGRERGDPVA
ncbi:MAG: Hsp20/alpha crystallin family protein [Casimicrobiaceae bacterium]